MAAAHIIACFVFFATKCGAVNGVTSLFGKDVFFRQIMHSTGNDILPFGLGDSTLLVGRSRLDAHVGVARAATVTSIRLADLSVALLSARSGIGIMLVPSAR